jgi:hypothetical protein
MSSGMRRSFADTQAKNEYDADQELERILLAIGKVEMWNCKHKLSLDLMN